MAIPVPQYGYLRDSNERVIVVQAEEANGMKMFGVRALDGQESVVTEEDIELLGVTKPSDR
ncbi:hypothetical protein SAMN02745126_00614 [Enhydrobacter aerosaccus]|uniref:Uncharacterized protein n=1 Tax=Enhydrobacter aerosaccus TaxID=225324 RepID=A0A1T4K0A1_9HYPH|nr:hypothetical protein [Enhydrobacter aerosaccus]SJZ35799.1 hypothetical protein SAMN02745126_00614 [Enhydrobacter aerosaccus]